MYRYNINNKLITSAKPIQGEIPLTMTDAEAKYCIGFDKGTPIYDEAARQRDVQAAKQKQIDAINLEFERQCSIVGATFEGNNFQFDDISRSRLLEVKDDSRVDFWRSVGNVNVPMTNTKKNSLYSALVLAFYTKFAEKSAQIDALG